MVPKQQRHQLPKENVYVHIWLSYSKCLNFLGGDEPGEEECHNLYSSKSRKPGPRSTKVKGML